MVTQSFAVVDFPGKGWDTECFRHIRMTSFFMFGWTFFGWVTGRVGCVASHVRGGEWGVLSGEEEGFGGSHDGLGGCFG